MSTPDQPLHHQIQIDLLLRVSSSMGVVERLPLIVKLGGRRGGPARDIFFVARHVVGRRLLSLRGEKFGKGVFANVRRERTSEEGEGEGGGE